MSNRLCNIKDDFWIIKGDWRTGSRGIGYHQCPSINTIGKIQIGISENLEDILHFVTIDINSNIDDFDFTQLKNDFEGELWNLITSNKSNVSSEKIEIRYCEKIFRFAENKSITEFLKAFDQVAKNPKRELSQTKGLRRTEKVIPISETYRKLSTAGIAAFLPSKTILENHDVYENRFICFMLHSIYLIVSKNVKYSSLPIGRLEKEIETLSQKMTSLEDPDPKVNPEEIEKEILFQESRVNESISYWKSISDGLVKFEFNEKLLQQIRNFSIMNITKTRELSKNNSIPRLNENSKDNTNKIMPLKTEKIVLQQQLSDQFSSLIPIPFSYPKEQWCRGQ
jgi:hypothetical protein